MIHFLKKCFQKVLMTSWPWPPRAPWGCWAQWLAVILFGDLLGCLHSSPPQLICSLQLSRAAAALLGAMGTGKNPVPWGTF